MRNLTKTIIKKHAAEITFSKHFVERMQERNVKPAEIAEALKSNPWHDHTNKFRLTTKTIELVISDDLCLITCYRLKK